MPAGNGVTESRSYGDTELQSYSGIRESQETQETHDSARGATVLSLHQAAQYAIELDLSENCLWTFARAVRLFEINTKTRLPANELENAFNYWWNLAKDHFPDGERDEFLFQFEDCCAKAKYPLGCNVLAQAIEQAKHRPAPKEANDFTSAKIKLLIGVCYQLQKGAGENAFFLGVRDAAKLMQCKTQTAVAFMNGLVTKGILALEQKGTMAGRRASRFRYVALAPYPCRTAKGQEEI